MDASRRSAAPSLPGTRGSRGSRGVGVYEGVGCAAALLRRLGSFRSAAEASRGFLLPPSPFFLPPSSFLARSSFLLPSSFLLLPPSSFLLPHSSFLLVPRFGPPGECRERMPRLGPPACRGERSSSFAAAGPSPSPPPRVYSRIDISTAPPGLFFEDLVIEVRKSGRSPAGGSLLDRRSALSPPRQGLLPWEGGIALLGSPRASAPVFVPLLLSHAGKIRRPLGRTFCLLGYDVTALPALCSVD